MQVVFEPPRGLSAPEEIIIEIIRRYRGRIMRLLVVSKWVGRIALDYLIDTVGEEKDVLIGTSVLGAPRNVRRVYMRAQYDIMQLNPIKLIVAGRMDIPDVALTRLTKLILHRIADARILLFTTLTSLILYDRCDVDSLSLLTCLRKLQVANDIDIDGLSLDSLTVFNQFSHISCTTLQSLTIIDIVPALAKRVLPVNVYLCGLAIPGSYIPNMCRVQRLRLEQVMVPDGFFAGLTGLRKLSLTGSKGPSYQELCAMTQLSRLAVHDAPSWTDYDGYESRITTLSITNGCFIWLYEHKHDFVALRKLTIDCGGTDDLLRCFTSVTSLSIYGSDGENPSEFTNAGLAPLTQLQRLKIMHNRDITSDGLSHLDALTWLDLNDTRIDITELYRAIKRRRSLYGNKAINPAKSLLCLGGSL